jgi:hypothetical protein
MMKTKQLTAKLVKVISHWSKYYGITPGRDLSKEIKRSHYWWYERVRGNRSFNLNDLGKIADVLGFRLDNLLAHAMGYAPLERFYMDVMDMDEEEAIVKLRLPSRPYCMDSEEAILALSRHQERIGAFPPSGPFHYRFCVAIGEDVQETSIKCAVDVNEMLQQEI